MIEILAEKDCCGCGACMAVCPKQCIQMVPGTLGAVFPRVDTSICIQCGACERVCPVLNAEDAPKAAQQKAYAVIAKDAKTRFAASSGGAFGVLASGVIAGGGIVYGAAFDQNLQLKCTVAESLEEL